MSGTYINKVAQKAQNAGYEITLIYIFLENEDICVERVKDRVIKGGHDVPVEDIKRRYYRSKRNFWVNFTSLVNSWFLLYNGDEGFQEVAIGDNGHHAIINKILFDLFFKNYRDETS